MPFQTSAAYMLFYHRHTEGMPSKSRKLDRTLSESFADEVQNARSGEASVEKSKEDSIQEDMEEEKIADGTWARSTLLTYAQIGQPQANIGRPSLRYIFGTTNMTVHSVYDTCTWR